MKVLTSTAVVLALFAASVASANAAATSVANPTQSAMPADTTTSAATNVLTIDQMKPMSSPWSASFFQGLYNGARASNTGNYDSAYGDAIISASYKLNDSQKLTVMQYIMMNQTDAARTDEVALYDTALRFSDAKALQIMGSDVASDTRLLLPTSEWSQDIGKIEFRQALAMERQLAAKLKLEYGIAGRAYTYTERKDGQRYARSFVTSQLNYEAAKWATPYVGLYHEGAWRHNGKALAPDGSLNEKDNLYTTANLQLGSSFSMGPVGLNLYVEQTRSLRAEDSFRFLDDDATGYNLEMSVSL